MKKQQTTPRTGSRGTRAPKTLAVRLYDDEIFLQPWFVSKSTFLKFRTMLPSCHLLKLRYYFDDYGCIRCGKIQARYGHNGFCRTCARIVSSRMIYALKRRFRRLGIPIPTKPIEKLLAALDSATSMRPEEIAREGRLRSERQARGAIRRRPRRHAR